jgi:hypothetical protein
VVLTGLYQRHKKARISICPGAFKGPVFRKGHRIRPDDICHLQRPGKEHVFVLTVVDEHLHEDDAARACGDRRHGPWRPVPELRGMSIPPLPFRQDVVTRHSR